MLVAVAGAGAGAGAGPESERVKAEYAYYTAKFAEEQALSDEFDSAMGIPRTDLAWKKVMEREQARRMPDWAAVSKAFKFDLQVKAYSQAIGVQNA